MWLPPAAARIFSHRFLNGRRNAFQLRNLRLRCQFGNRAPDRIERARSGPSVDLQAPLALEHANGAVGLVTEPTIRADHISQAGKVLLQLLYKRAT